MKGRTPAPDEWDRWLARYLKRLEATGHAARTIQARRDMARLFIAYTKEAGIRGPEGVPPPSSPPTSSTAGRPRTPAAGRIVPGRSTATSWSSGASSTSWRRRAWSRLPSRRGSST